MTMKGNTVDQKVSIITQLTLIFTFLMEKISEIMITMLTLIASIIADGNMI